MEPQPEPASPPIVLFVVTKEHSLARAGLPPNNPKDDYPAQSTTLGKLDVSKIAFSPNGELYAIVGQNLFRGPMPTNTSKDWLSYATQVGSVDWDKMKFILFDPAGVLYAATNDGHFYKGPAPTNIHVSWLYREAIHVGKRLWETLHALFFDNHGILYAVTSEGKLVKREPPTHPNDAWLYDATVTASGDWCPLCPFIAFSRDDYLWCVNEKGFIYRGQAPTPNSGDYIKNAVKLGADYHKYKLLAFSVDKTMQNVLSFEFLPASGTVTSEDVEVLQRQNYDNTSSVPLKFKFTISRTITETSIFSHEHGFTAALEAQLTFEAGIPFLGNVKNKISINTSTSHTWDFSTINEIKTNHSSTTEVEVPPGKSIQLTASVKKGSMDVPFRAKIKTMFGYETFITGTWKGVSYCHLNVSQEDYKPDRTRALC